MSQKSPQLSAEYAPAVATIDPMAEQLRDNLEMVARTTQEVLEEAVKKVTLVLGNAQATEQERAEAIQELQKITGGARAAEQGVRDFTQGQEAQDQYTQGVLEFGDQPLTPAQAHKGVEFLNAAAEYYSRSRTGMMLAGQALDSTSGLDQVLSRRGGSLQTQRRSFWQTIADTALGIETIIQRVNSLPDRLAATIVGGTTNAVEALNKTGRDWSERTRSTYTTLRDESVGVVQTAADSVGAIGDVILSQTESKMATAGQFVSQRMMAPIGNFLTQRVIPFFQQAAVAVSDTLSSQVQEISSDFKQSLAKRQQARMGQATVSEPEPQATKHSM